ncbi:unnamed protein product [Paramecium sonneborni]|uniref:Uncharacterized protein n=1 Tax=Paramecium sonneborni TaxID=65129 RepID=A0A8S1K3K6_9CILI|nr:unnamed protein product [Paramecium sonneborni]
MTFYVLKQNMQVNSKQLNTLIPFQGFYYYPFGVYEIPFQLPNILTSQYKLVNNNELKIKQEVKEEYESESQQEACKKKIVKFSPYIYPGETKNYYKNIAKKLSSFIINSFDHTILKQDPVIMQFLKIQDQHYNRIHFQRLFSSKIGRKMAKKFFGNFIWCSQFLEQNKTDIDLYFRHNKLMFIRKKRQQCLCKK